MGVMVWRSVALTGRTIGRLSARPARTFTTVRVSTVVSEVLPLSLETCHPIGFVLKTAQKVHDWKLAVAAQDVIDAFCDVASVMAVSSSWEECSSPSARTYCFQILCRSLVLITKLLHSKIVGCFRACSVTAQNWSCKACPNFSVKFVLGCWQHHAFDISGPAFTSASGSPLPLFEMDVYASSTISGKLC